MRSEEKLMVLAVKLNTAGSKSTNYVLGRIVGAIDMVIIDNEGADGHPLLISDPDDLTFYIIQFWATKEQMDRIRATLPRMTRKLAEYRYYRKIWRNDNEKKEKES